MINYPDSFGLACEFFDASFQLGDTAFVLDGLPNFVNYDLAALAGADSCETVGVQTIAETSGLKIYPNPANHYIFLSDKNNTAIGCEALLFYNVTGVLTKKILHPPAAIDVSDLPQGMYVAQVKYSTGESNLIKLEILR